MLDVRDFGAAGDGRALDTEAIQGAIEACGAAGGGTVYFPAGAYVTGALILRSHVTLYLEAGAVLLGSEDPTGYPVVRSRWEGVEQETYAPLIGGSHLEGIGVVGRGTVDGRGDIWWERFRESRDLALRYPRPRLISFVDCRNVLIEGLTLTRSPSWTINPVRCRNVTIDKVTIFNPPDSPNTDGINPDSCANVHISNCHIDVGDDCIAIKSGTEAGDSDKRAPCENVTITNCTMVHGHGGVVIGSEMSGGVRNVVVSNCIFEGTDRGIRLEIAAGPRRGGGRHPRDQRHHGGRLVPVRSEPLLRLRRMGRQGRLGQAASPRGRGDAVLPAHSPEPHHGPRRETGGWFRHRAARDAGGGRVALRCLRLDGARCRAGIPGDGRRSGTDAEAPGCTSATSAVCGCKMSRSWDSRGRLCSWPAHQASRHRAA